MYNLRDSREGVGLNTSELFTIAHIIAPLINKGQYIVNNHPELNVCVKTLYNYIVLGLFKDWGITNLSLKRKVKRKNRNKKNNKTKKRRENVDYTNRTYADYLEFIAKHPDIPTTEMDTVMNNQSGPYIQTFIFENTSLMIGILHSEKTSYAMSSSLNKFEELFKEDYSKLFRLILTDRGPEFSKADTFELTPDTNTLRTNIFYCDPQQSSQKPHVENNHNFIREILPNGKNWSHLTQEKIDLMFSHINSVPRASLNGKTPYEMFSFLHNEEILNKLNIQKIAKDEVTLKPHLLK